MRGNIWKSKKSLIFLDLNFQKFITEDMLQLWVRLGLFNFSLKSINCHRPFKELLKYNSCIKSAFKDVSITL